MQSLFNANMPNLQAVQLVLDLSQVKHYDAQGSQLAEELLLLVLLELLRKKPSPQDESMSMQR
jgi:hypothetical protein